MVTGIVLINVERAKIDQVVDQLEKISGVTEVYTVAGEYDLVAVIRVSGNAELASIIATKMTNVSGIVHTKTLITLTARSRVDLAQVFGVAEEK